MADLWLEGEIGEGWKVDPFMLSCLSLWGWHEKDLHSGAQGAKGKGSIGEELAQSGRVPWVNLGRVSVPWVNLSRVSYWSMGRRFTGKRSVCVGSSSWLCPAHCGVCRVGVEKIYSVWINTFTGLSSYPFSSKVCFAFLFLIIVHLCVGLCMWV